MLSVCIPIYNCNVTQLVNCLHQQMLDSGTRFEIVLIDDFSHHQFKSVNSNLNNLNSVTYIELDKNLGRSAIRNLFLQYTNYEYLLFFDCDSLITDNQFISKYLQQIDQNTEVICGGTVYEKSVSKAHNNFRYKYGIARETVSVEKRNQNSYFNFKANNFLIKKSVLNAIKFDERLNEYGHEDSLFAYGLKKEQINLKHIENPVVHLANESFDEFWAKTKHALKNLQRIQSEFALELDFAEMNRLLKFHDKVRRFSMQIPLLLLYSITFPFLKLIFKIGIFSPKLFDFFKLGYYNMIVVKIGLKMPTAKIIISINALNI